MSKEPYVCKDCGTWHKVGEMCRVEQFEKYISQTNEMVESYGTLINTLDRLLAVSQGLLAIINDLLEKLDEANNDRNHE